MSRMQGAKVTDRQKDAVEALRHAYEALKVEANAIRGRVGREQVRGAGTLARFIGQVASRLEKAADDAALALADEEDR